MSIKKLLLITIPLTACQMEYNMHGKQMPVFPGQCDIENPVAGREDQRPVARCSVSENLISPVWDTVNFIGEESTDPNGLDLVEFSWRLVEKPEGSAVGLYGSEVNKYGFSADMAGNYTIELVVMNEECIVSDPCQVEIQAVPDANLWVEMIWELEQDDMDLHLLQGNAEYNSSGDCYYGNCVSDFYDTPNWGDPNSERDDPHLDLDDIESRGPENINISEPADGKYRVVVHDYPGSIREEANNVTIRIHLDGEIAYEGTKSISGEDSFTPFVEIDWPSLTITPLD